MLETEIMKKIIKQSLYWERSINIDNTLPKLTRKRKMTKITNSRMKERGINLSRFYRQAQ